MLAGRRCGRRQRQKKDFLQQPLAAFHYKGAGYSGWRAYHKLHCAGIAGNRFYQAGFCGILVVVAYIHGVTLGGNTVGDDFYKVGGIGIKTVPGQSGYGHAKAAQQGGSE